VGRPRSLHVKKIIKGGPAPDLVEDPNIDLVAKIAGGDGQTILREALLVADHNAYHLGQLVDAKRALGGWKEE